LHDQGPFRATKPHSTFARRVLSLPGPHLHAGWLICSPPPRPPPANGQCSPMPGPQPAAELFPEGSGRRGVSPPPWCSAKSKTSHPTDPKRWRSFCINGKGGDPRGVDSGAVCAATICQYINLMHLLKGGDSASLRRGPTRPSSRWAELLLPSAFLRNTHICQAERRPAIDSKSVR